MLNEVSVMRFVFFLLFAACLHANTSREMIILIDSKGVEENIGRPLRRYLMNKLQSALQEQACPILVSASLWEAFLEKRESMRQMGAVPSTAENHTLEIYGKINERLNFWYRFYREQSLDPIQSQQLMLASINDEFYANEEFLNETSNQVSDDMNAAFMSYATPFHSEEWEGYTNNHSFVLLVPKKYGEEEERLSAECATGFTNREIHLGLKVDHLARIDDLENPARFYLYNPWVSIGMADSLSDFFVTREEDRHPHSWNIVLSGHGRHASPDSQTPQTEVLIADLTLQDFRKTLNFFEHNISTKCLYYATCYGAGNHLKLIFDQAGSSDYSYAMISDCFSDSWSYTFWHLLHFPNSKDDLLTSDEISYDVEKGWFLPLDYKYRWKDFFQEVAQNSFSSDSLSWLAQSLSHITPSLLCNTPSVRLPHSDKWMIILPDTYFRITDLVLRVNKKDTLILNENTEAVLLEAPQIAVPVTIKNTRRVPRMVSALPGSSRHFIKQLTLKTNYCILGAFWPLEGDFFNREILIEQLDFPAKDFSLKDQLHYEGDTITLKNVLIASEKSMLRIFFQTEEGISYMAVANKVNELARDASLKGLYPLNDECAELYLQRYYKSKKDGS